MVVLDSKVFIEAAGLDLFWRCNSTTFSVTCYSSSDLLWTQDELLSWGIISLTIAYIWKLYTLWILVQLHEAVPGKRYNRYVELAQAAFGERLYVWLALFPTVYLSAGTAKALILIGGETMKLFFQIVCGPLCSSNPLTTVGDKSKWKLNHPCGRCYPCWLCHWMVILLL